MNRARDKLKTIHHHRGTPPLLDCRLTPRSQRNKKSYGVYRFLGKTREKGIHHGSGKKGIHHRGPQTPKKKEKERRASSVAVYAQRGPHSATGRVSAFQAPSKRFL